MPEFGDRTFDAAIDKGTMDAILVRQSNDVHGTLMRGPRCAHTSVSSLQLE